MKKYILFSVFTFSLQAFACGGSISAPVHFTISTFDSTLDLRVVSRCGGSLGLSDNSNQRSLVRESGKLCLKITSDATSPTQKAEETAYQNRQQLPAKCNGLSECMTQFQTWYKDTLKKSPGILSQCDAKLWDGCTAAVRKMEPMLKGEYYDIIFKGEKCQKTLSSCGDELIGWFREREQEMKDGERKQWQAACAIDSVSDKMMDCRKPADELNYGGPTKDYKICAGDKLEGADAQGMKAALQIRDDSGQTVGSMGFKDGHLLIYSTDSKGQIAKNKPMLEINRTDDAIAVKGYKSEGGALAANLVTKITPECPRNQYRGMGEQQDPYDITGKTGSSFDGGGCSSEGGLDLKPLDSAPGTAH